MGVTRDLWRRYGPRLAENRAMAALATNVSLVAFASNLPQVSFLLATASWSTVVALLAGWAALTLPLQRLVARGSQKIYIENKRRWEIGFTMNRQVAIVTGASSGIGYELALMLAQLDCDVIMACRDEAKARDAIKRAESHVLHWRHRLEHLPFDPQFRVWGKRQQSRLRFMHLDLADEDSIFAFAKQINEQYEGIHILVNNGGIFTTTVEQITKSGHELQLGTNALGPYLLTELLLPKIKRRIVYVTSASHKMPEASETCDFVGLLDQVQYGAVAAEREVRDGDNMALATDGQAGDSAEPTQAQIAAKKRAEREAAIEYRIKARGMALAEARATATSLVYGPSKLLNLFHARELAERLKGRGIVAVACHPGGVTSSIFREVPIAEKLVGFTAPLFFKTPVQGARTVLACCVGEDIANGTYYADCHPAEEAATPLSKSKVQRDAAMLWCSEQWDFRVPLSVDALAPIEEIPTHAMLESEPQPYIPATRGLDYAKHILPD